MFRTLLLSCALLTPLCSSSQVTPAGLDVASLPLGQKYEYKTVDGHTLNLWVSQPANPSTNLAVVVFFHGGGWIAGSPSQFNTQAAAITAHGGVAVEVDYRLLDKETQGSVPPSICVEDTKSALRWVRTHAKQWNVNPNRVVAAGGSAGGFDAAYAAMVPGWDAPSDDLHVSAKPNVLVLFNPVIDVSPGHYGHARFGDEFTKRSPLLFVDKSAPPVLLMSGSEDKIATPETLRDFQRRILAGGGQCELVFYEGQGHGFFGHEPYLTKTTDEMIRFLQSLRYLN